MVALKNNEDAAFYLVNVLEFILKLTSTVYATVETIHGEDESFNADMFTLCTLAIDNGIIDTVSALLAATLTTRESKLNLGSDGSVTIEAQTFVNATTVQTAEVSSPTPAIKQAQIVLQTLGLLPDITDFIRDAVTTIMGFTQKEEKELEEL
ncbi:MAG: hypothetical protein LBP88_02830 [Treponema sp.]|jgi:hypothetical protein|nr:hypothetical protein [Treponema sp.]